MTTQLILLNAGNSNGDIHLNVDATFCEGDEMVTRPAGPEQVLTPGTKANLWLSTAHTVKITETWPTEKPANDAVKQGAVADMLIASEVATQDKMWGDANERADGMKGQLLAASLAQAHAVYACAEMPSRKREVNFEYASGMYYPKDWTGFRDYGSDIANLVVAAAYLRNEIKRRLLKGESYHRAPRVKPYEGDKPAMSSDEARGITGGGEPATCARDPALTINEHAHGDDAS